MAFNGGGVSRVTFLAFVAVAVGIASLVLGVFVVVVYDGLTTSSANRGASYAVSTVLSGGRPGTTDIEETVEAYGTALALLPDFQAVYSWKIGKYRDSGGSCADLTVSAVNSMFGGTLRGAGWDVSDAFSSGVLTDTRGTQLACYGVAIPNTVDEPDRILVVDYPPISDVFSECKRAVGQNQVDITYTDSGVTYRVYCTANALDPRLLNGARIVLAYHY